MAWLYILRLKSGALYVGATDDLDARYREHQEGTACRTTSADPPAELAHSEEFDTFAASRKRETQVKRWSRAKKEALISGNLRSLKSLARPEFTLSKRSASKGLSKPSLTALSPDQSGSKGACRTGLP